MRIEKKTNRAAYAIRFSLMDREKEIGRVYLYVLKNDLHKEPFGFLEDLFVDEKYRGKRLGTELVKTAIAEAKRRGCYKLFATSRKERKNVHRFYEKLGVKKYGFEFRKDF